MSDKYSLTGSYSKRNLIITAVVSILFGSLFLYGIVTDIASWERFCDTPVHVTATVYDNEYRSYRGHHSYYPWVYYELDGQQHSVMIYESNKKAVPVGTVRDITVDGNDPERLLSQPDAAELSVGILLILIFFSVGGAALIQLKFNPKFGI